MAIIEIISFLGAMGLLSGAGYGFTHMTGVELKSETVVINSENNLTSNNTNNEDINNSAYTKEVLRVFIPEAEKRELRELTRSISLKGIGIESKDDEEFHGSHNFRAILINQILIKVAQLGRESGLNDAEIDRLKLNTYAMICDICRSEFWNARKHDLYSNNFEDLSLKFNPNDNRDYMEQIHGDIINPRINIQSGVMYGVTNGNVSFYPD
ncbi:MAG: hypothetical protein RsTaC01_0206 [Candidatus Paraimprobicoccus trichonymphae]|uniref:Uncharacterized protein n=1 Tax=Candidatus Paraimprobicoccus trichonymphae TaxID=3033793 RepID=A0AA48KXJ6_9FIRM|nr:MAG: hypothetical protein RsTaC01_0206 [Candidatus Paraimprobicoccus trichonymphae]